MRTAIRERDIDTVKRLIEEEHIDIDATIEPVNTV